MTPASRLEQLTEQGVAVWFDSISCERLASGGLAALVQESSVVGVTSNPTIFDQALSAGTAYEEQIRDFGVRGVPVEEAARAVAGANVQRPLWASTGVKNPAYPDTLYVANLIAAYTVSTMPETTLHATQDHGTISSDSITGHFADSAHILAELSAVGVDYDNVVEQLERKGVSKGVSKFDY